MLTGPTGNSGIGFETAKQLALRNARVYIASRSHERVSDAIYQMNQSAGRNLDLNFLQMDLQDLKSVHAAAASFMHRETRLDILINNAGVSTASQRPAIESGR
jgi:NAD(P)-dependent dehydrogenase (short-subunit alcohol dehydrogenase family)